MYLENPVPIYLNGLLLSLKCLHAYDESRQAFCYFCYLNFQAYNERRIN